MGRKKLIPLNKLRDQADKVFSRWIRDRDTVDGLYVYDEEGFAIRCGYCFTCGGVTPTEGRSTGDAGHFVKRGIKNVRFNEHNVHLQCKRCNKHLNGNEGWYAVNLDKTYGSGTADGLKQLEAIYKREGFKLTRDYLDGVIERYKKYEPSQSDTGMEVLDMFKDL